MPSIIPGYEYDIFISYRQKDNKGDRWVSEFVEALKTELESTFKEEISVYFDINPHDGLLETHDVDASLKEKLKCLVFIPIISRTYCDPKSYAWEHEFKAFVDMASQDQFGLKIKLSNGNVASRVLPIRIYDLNNTDIKLCETVLGGILRGVEFVYAEPGVNRPLKPDDDEKVNLNNTKYRNQINKVGNAIQEIIYGLLTEPTELVKEKPLHRETLEEVKKEEKKEVQEKPTKLFKRKLLIGPMALAVLLVIALIYTYTKVFKRDILEKLRSSGERISVAVMPFQNLTNDTIWDVWQDGIQNELINNLTNSEEFQVRQTEAVTSLMQVKGLTDITSLTPSVANTISKKLNAKIFIYGSIKQAGNSIRINAQLYDSRTEAIFKSFQNDGTEDEIMQITDSLATLIKDFLLVSELQKSVDSKDLKRADSNSPLAVKYFHYGLKAVGLNERIRWFEQAIDIDSNFCYAKMWLIGSYLEVPKYNDAKKWCEELYTERSILSPFIKTEIDYYHARIFGTPDEAIMAVKKRLAFDDQYPGYYNIPGKIYCYDLKQYDKAIPELERGLQIYKQQSRGPDFWNCIDPLAYSYYKTGQYKKERMLLKYAEKYFPDNPNLIRHHVILSLTEGKTKKTSDYIEKYKTTLKKNSYSDAAIFSNLASAYYEAGLFEKAEDLLKQALSLEPGNPVRFNNLAYFLIDKDRNINEGLEIIDKALVLSPDDYKYLHTKGWGLFKQGKHQEALKFLQQSWDLRREKAIYNHEAFLHLEAAKKAVAEQKNN